jgi:hypothetical protein
MPKGFYSQCFCVLTDGSTTIGHIKAALTAGGFEIAKEVEASDQWAMRGASVVVPYLPKKNGYVVVDVVNRAWPDSMGDPKSDPILFGAWSMGQFGPGAFPRGLPRARQHAWSWREGDRIAASHRGFIRMRISYVGGAAPNAPILPQDYDPVGELLFLTRMTTTMLRVPGALCYLNPNGEVLRSPSDFTKTFTACQQQRKFPLLLWSNVRFYTLNEQLSFMDTVGNEQFDIRDVEAAFESDPHEPAEIDYYLRNVTHYLMSLGREIQTGESIDGPNERNLSWIAESRQQGALEPPRPVLRLCPKSIQHQVQTLLGGL